MDADNAPDLNARLRRARGEIRTLDQKRADLLALAESTLGPYETPEALTACLRAFADRLLTAADPVQQRAAIQATIFRIDRVSADAQAFDIRFHFSLPSEFALSPAGGQADGNKREYTLRFWLQPVGRAAAAG